MNVSLPVGIFAASSSAAGAATVGGGTLVPLSIAAGGIILAVGMAWRAGKWQQSMDNRIRNLERRVGKVEKEG